MELTKEFVKSCNKPSILREFLLQAMDQIDAMEEERRWRKCSEGLPPNDLEGEDFIVSNGFYSVICEWRGYWNNEPFMGDKNCDRVKYWMQAPKAQEDK